YTTATTYSGGCGTVVKSQTPTAGTLVGSGPHTITITVTDGSSNTATCSATFTVVDVTAPTIGNVGANATIECTATPNFTAPTASDNCGGTTINLVSDVTTAGSCVNNYTRTKTWDATDASGNQSATVSQTITVRDTQAPAIGGQGADATIECTATPSFTSPTASDACGTSSVNLISDVTAAGSCANNYTRTKTWDATDA